MATLATLQSTMLKQVKEPHHADSKDDIWNLVGDVQSMVRTLQCNTNPQNVSIHQTISMLKIEALVIGATRFAEAQQRFRMYGLPTHVDIGFQYYFFDGTFMKNVIGPTNSFSAHSGAIYTSDDPFAHYPHVQSDPWCGNMMQSKTKKIVGFMVARLKGNINQGQGSQSKQILLTPNQPPAVVLNQTEQCLPLLCFSPAKLIIDMVDDDAPPGNLILYEYQCRLQEILDPCFNGGAVTNVCRALPSEHLMFQPLALAENSL